MNLRYQPSEKSKTRKTLDELKFQEDFLAWTLSEFPTVAPRHNNQLDCDALVTRGTNHRRHSKLYSGYEIGVLVPKWSILRYL